MLGIADRNGPAAHAVNGCHSLPVTIWLASGQKTRRKIEQEKKSMSRLIVTLSLGAVALLCGSVASAQGRVPVKVVERHDSSVEYSYAFANQYGGVAQNLHLQGASFTLRLPNGDTAVVNCTSKFQERFAGPGNVRSCRVPMVDEFEADFSGDKAKLIWPTSLDGKKTASETYRIIAVAKGPR
jgi:hypothetical protein